MQVKIKTRTCKLLFFLLSCVTSQPFLTGVFVAPGHVGPPLPCNFIKLVDVAEMNYFAANGEGEVSQHRMQQGSPSICSEYKMYCMC